MKEQAKVVAMMLSSFPSITYEHVPGSKRYKLLSTSGIVWRKSGEPRWGNVHYDVGHILIVIDYPQGAFTEVDFKDSLKVPSNKNKKETGFYITYSKGTGPAEHDSLRIKLYGDDVFNQLLVDRIMIVASEIYKISTND